MTYGEEYNSYKYVLSNPQISHNYTPGVCQENSILWILAADIRERRFTKARVIALRSRDQAANTGGNMSLCATRSHHAPSLWAAHTPADTNTRIHTLGMRNSSTHTYTHTRPNSSLNSSLQLWLHVTEHWTPNGEYWLCSCHVRPFKPLHRNSLNKN